MERQLKILFLYFGQPRMVEETLSEHESFISRIKTFLDAQVDIHYCVWNKYFEYTSIYPENNDRKRNTNKYKVFDVGEDLKNTLVKNDNIKCDLYDYSIVDSLWNNVKEYGIQKDTFYIKFSQTISKALGVDTLKNKNYDIVFMLRTDLLFHRKKDFAYEKLVDKFLQYTSKRKHGVSEDDLRPDSFIFTPYVVHSSLGGAKVDDKFWISNSKSLKKLFSNWQEKIKYYVQYYAEHTKIDFRNLSQHNVAAEFSSMYDRKHFTDLSYTMYIPMCHLVPNLYAKDIVTIVRNIDKDNNFYVGSRIGKVYAMRKYTDKLIGRQRNILDEELFK